MRKSHYLAITKPGIIFGNLITAIGGFYLVKPHASFLLLCFVLIGIALVVASGCVLNNAIDHDIDPLMERTKHRPSALGIISLKKLYIIGAFLGLLGFAELFFLTNPLTSFIAFIGFLFYVVAYSLYFKRRSIFGTAVGSVSGAIPPVIGYCAANNTIDLGAIIIFFILVFWQMPHSYAIAIYRFNDYTAGKIPVLPIKKGMLATKISMCLHTSLFFILSLCPTFLGYTNIYYFVGALLLGLYWLYLTIKGFYTDNNIAWARKVFIFSIIEITMLCILMVIF